MDQQGCTVVRRATEGDIDDIVRVLAQAFETDDPIEEYVFPAPEQRLRRTPGMLRIMVRHRFLPVGGASVATIDDRVVGAALWQPPGTRTSWWREAVSGPQLLWAMGAATARGMAVDAAMAKVAPAQPHLFLVYLGCEPGLQRRGVGRALWAALAADADARGAGLGGICKDGNVAYYRALGCEFVERVRIGRDGPEMNFVLRPPAT
ncbi:GNAT family N-acetyltransferase [Nocardia higoensis]|uniref:GNAT family N-acetyltransferase n=1 Tax=Nocardia higoensis TaxID=228599 RepID=UPI001FE093F7|nr:GNAT family N-acetyltransferase [Nocardia higoensis]